MTQHFTIPVVPMGKPRMTQADKWRRRECVVRYRGYADAIRAETEGRMEAPVSVSWVAYLPIPPSWSGAKRRAHMGQPHKSKPDRDNIDKGILDALFEADACVASGVLVKRWEDEKGPRIELTLSDDPRCLPDLLAQVRPGDSAAVRQAQA